MTVAFLGNQVASELHRKFLKPQGFRKYGATFVREREGFIETYNIQGSPWNSGAEPWEFYVNVGVRFPDIAPLRGVKLTPTYVHASGRSNSILPGTPLSFKVTEDSVSQVAESLWRIIVQMSENLPSIIQVAYRRARSGYYSFLPVPDTWEKFEL